MLSDGWGVQNVGLCVDKELCGIVCGIVVRVDFEVCRKCGLYVQRNSMVGKGIGAR
jgi:hypothetical protein